MGGFEWLGFGGGTEEDKRQVEIVPTSSSSSSSSSSSAAAAAAAASENKVGETDYDDEYEMGEPVHKNYIKECMEVSWLSMLFIIVYIDV